MTGTLAQLIALTAFGNHYLKNGVVLTDFSSNNSTFQFCNKIDFVTFKKSFFSKNFKEKVIANNPNAWFEYLKSEGCQHLRLYFESSASQSSAPDHKLAGFVGGGGSWLIEAIYDTYSNYWANRWEVTEQEAADNRIWTVSYGLTVSKQAINNMQFDEEDLKEELRQTLIEIADFAYKKDLENWGEMFDKSKEILDSSTPEESYYHQDLITFENYSCSAKQLIFAASSAWVFGGMGSWNDLGFQNAEDNEMYDRLSGQLYSIINEAILAGVNSY